MLISCGVWCVGGVWQLLNAGFVCKENFDRDDVDKYEEEKVSPPPLPMHRHD